MKLFKWNKEKTDISNPLQGQETATKEPKLISKEILMTIFLTGGGFYETIIIISAVDKENQHIIKAARHREIDDSSRGSWLSFYDRISKEAVIVPVSSIDKITYKEIK